MVIGRTSNFAEGFKNVDITTTDSSYDEDTNMNEYPSYEDTNMNDIISNTTRTTPMRSMPQKMDSPRTTQAPRTTQSTKSQYLKNSFNNNSSDNNSSKNNSSNPSNSKPSKNNSSPFSNIKNNFEDEDDSNDDLELEEDDDKIIEGFQGSQIIESRNLKNLLLALLLSFIGYIIVMSSIKNLLPINEYAPHLKKFKNLIYVGIFFLISYMCLEIF